MVRNRSQEGQNARKVAGNCQSDWSRRVESGRNLVKSSRIGSKWQKLASGRPKTRKEVKMAKIELPGGQKWPKVPKRRESALGRWSKPAPEGQIEAISRKTGLNSHPEVQKRLKTAKMRENDGQIEIQKPKSPKRRESDQIEGPGGSI